MRIEFSSADYILLEGTLVGVRAAHQPAREGDIRIEPGRIVYSQEYLNRETYLKKDGTFMPMSEMLKDGFSASFLIRDGSSEEIPFPRPGEFEAGFGTLTLVRRRDKMQFAEVVPLFCPELEFVVTGDDLDAGRLEIEVDLGKLFKIQIVDKQGRAIERGPVLVSLVNFTMKGLIEGLCEAIFVGHPGEREAEVFLGEEPADEPSEASVRFVIL